MNRVLTACLLAALPVVAQAQETQVPAILQTQAAAEAQGSGSAIANAAATPGSSMASASANAGAAGNPGTQLGSPPSTFPPAVSVLSPSAPLNPKETRAAVLSRRWQNRAQMPVAGKDGAVHYLYGATLPSVVCAPLFVCTVELQPGEIITDMPFVGDTVRWLVTPSRIGSGATTATTIQIKPTDAGLITSMTVNTNRRSYTFKLVSTQKQWMPRVALDYPDDQDAKWADYLANNPVRQQASGGRSGPGTGEIDMNYTLGGDSPVWKPRHVYTDGFKTYIDLPAAAARTNAPSLVALAPDGGWFSKPTPQVVNYRQEGNRLVVDSVLQRAALVSGVGSGKVEVTITRETVR